MQPLFSQLRALKHTEAVLLVDDDESQPMEPHVALHQSMRADDERDGAPFDLGTPFAPGGAGRGSGEEGDPEA
jgi:hypothetical protein